MLIEAGSSQWRALFRTFRRSAFRLETLPSYTVTAEEGSRLHFASTGEYLPWDGQQQWAAAIAEGRRDGRTHTRVRLVRPGQYMWWGLHAYAMNVGAGEDIRIIPQQASIWQAGVDAGDYWLFDRRRMLRMIYQPDGRFAGGEPVRNPVTVSRAARLADQLVAAATSYSTYMEQEASELPAR